MARSAISVLIDQVNDISLGKHPLVKRLIKVYLRHGQSSQNKEQFGVFILCLIILDHPENLIMGLFGKKMAVLMCLIARRQRFSNIACN